MVMLTAKALCLIISDRPISLRCRMKVSKARFQTHFYDFYALKQYTSKFSVEFVNLIDFLNTSPFLIQIGIFHLERQ